MAWPYTKSAGAATHSYMTNPLQERNMAYEVRPKSVLGALSRPMKGRTVKSGDGDRSEDVAMTAAVMRKTITTGDECRFHMLRRLEGPMTAGDKAPAKGGYLSFRHQRVMLNTVRSPAFQVMGEMSRQRIAEILSDPASATRQELVMWHHEQYWHDAYRAFFKGMSDNLRLPESEGGIALDLGRGAGKQVSPLNAIVFGTGIIGGATLDARETALNTAIDNLSASNAKHRISIAALHALKEALPDLGLTPLRYEGADEERYALILPRLLHGRLTQPGGDLYSLWQAAEVRGPQNPAFGHKAISWGPFIIYEDGVLDKFCPDSSGDEIVWGSDDLDLRKFKVTDATQKTHQPAILLGGGALLEASNDKLRVTEEEGDHETGLEVSGRIKRAIMRSMWDVKDGSNELPIDQSSALVMFAEPGTDFGA